MRFQELEDTGIETAIATAVDKAVAVAVTTAVAETERQGNIRTAKSMIMEGFDTVVISRITKLPEKQIIALM